MFLIKEGSRASENPRPTNFDQEMSVDRIEDDSSDAFGGFESDEEEEKDSTELELEAAVFGDEAGFHERLKRHGVTRDNRDFTTTVAKDVQDEAEDDIRDIDDADVCFMLVLVRWPSECSFVPSYLSSIRGLPRNLHSHSCAKVASPPQTLQMQHGMIVMMNASLSPFEQILGFEN